ncbi:unnamed protein product [Rotaria sp. Silwood1]|nr:unnamed protein product [Rotaria sp. Silwood1]CAF1680989.1 unnamed protein product [Rotaria sp. Silwood1]
MTTTTTGSMMSTTVTTTTVTTTTTTTTTTTVTTTTVTTTTTTTVTTITTATPICGSTCVNTSISTLSRVAFYSFDSTTTDATGTGTCLTMWGLTSSGSVTVNVVNSSNSAVSATASSTLSVNTWTHVAQTFSSTSGSRLYIGGVLITSVSAPTGTPVGPYAFIGASPTGSSTCNAGLIATGQFYGSVDEFRVFGRELTATDICRLANP